MKVAKINNTQMIKRVLLVTLSALALSTAAVNAKSVTDEVIAKQRAALEKNTHGKGFGPQSPRDIEQFQGTNLRRFAMAPDPSELNLCNIHFHKNAEHKGGEYTTYAGNGDGQGYNTGYVYNGQLSAQQLTPVTNKVCAAKGDSLQVGDTLEVHFVYSSAQVKPGPTLGACLADTTMNPALRVEGQVIVLANDDEAIDFDDLADVERINGYYQAPNVPTNMGESIEYLGSTTGPSYNQEGSPLQVSWSIRPKVAVVDINSVGEWCDDNEFNEDHAHAVRNLVQNPKLLSPIMQ
ncbi:delta-class carbonic anhydrase [Pseudoalteromonas mariniglutinosa]|uniref:delta-class carbonic anhydrase n=1 Tax=Pseudoalteromonas mariniglutinosa TaxID=206042 RepID=UPI003850DFA6